MTEYIEREAALNASKIVYIEYIEIDGNGYEDGNADEIPVVFKRDIEAIPAADVAPVVHGRWMTKEYEYGDPEAGISDMWVDRPAEPSDDYAFCPVCGNDAGYTGEGCLILSDYCPNCGARMDEE